MSQYVRVYSVSMTSLVTSSSALDLSQSYSNMRLQVLNTMVSGNLYVLASHDGTTFSRLCGMGTDPVTHFTVGSASSQPRVIPIAGGYRYMKIENTSGVTDTVTVFKVICSD